MIGTKLIGPELAYYSSTNIRKKYRHQLKYITKITRVNISQILP